MIIHPLPPPLITTYVYGQMYILSSPSAPPPHTPLPLYRKLVHPNDWLIGPDQLYLCCSERWMGGRTFPGGGDYTLKLTSLSKFIMDFVFNCFLFHSVPFTVPFCCILFHSAAFVIYQCIHCNRYNISKSVYDIVAKVLICNFYCAKSILVAVLANG